MIRTHDWIGRQMFDVEVGQVAEKNRPARLDDVRLESLEGTDSNADPGKPSGVFYLSHFGSVTYRQILSVQPRRLPEAQQGN